MASESLTKSSVSKQPVVLKEKAVSGKVRAKVTTTGPKHDRADAGDALHGGTTYKVTVKGVKDPFGPVGREEGKAGPQPLSTPSRPPDRLTAAPFGWPPGHWGGCDFFFFFFGVGSVDAP